MVAHTDLDHGQVLTLARCCTTHIHDGLAVSIHYCSFGILGHIRCVHVEKPCACPHAGKLTYTHVHVNISMHLTSVLWCLVYGVGIYELATQ